MTGPRFDLHAMRYGRIVSNDLPSPYSEAQCAACAYGHRCCDMVILVTPAEVAGILQWLDQGLERIGYLDIDAHHGDGVQDAIIIGRMCIEHNVIGS